MGLFNNLFSNGNNGSLSALDLKNGFRDLSFGCEIQNVPGMVLVIPEDDAGNAVYQRPSDSLKIGEADLNEIVYVAYRGTLYKVMLVAESYAEYNRLLEVFLKAYGTPKYTPGVDDYSWMGSVVDLFACWGAIKDTGLVTFTNVQILERIKSDRESDAIKGVSDL